MSAGLGSGLSIAQQKHTGGKRAINGVLTLYNKLFAARSSHHATTWILDYISFTRFGSHCVNGQS